MGDGTTTEFNFNFPFYENTNIIVKKNNSIASDYTIVGTLGGLNADIPYTAGKVVFNVAPISTDVITISRKISLKRYVDYQPTEKINPTILNQDQNYTIEIIKDFDGKFEEIDEKYAEIIDTESTQTLINKIDTVTTQITNLGDISTLRGDVSDLKTTSQSHTSTLETHTTNISTLNTRTNGMIDYVIESQAPTSANNYTWYRKYKSGWVEQGGVISGRQGSVTLPIQMNSTYYTILHMPCVSTTPTEAGIPAFVSNVTSQSFTLYNNNGDAVLWTVKGQSA